MLSEKAGDGDGKGAKIVVVDDGIGPGVFLPGGEKIKDAYRRDGRRGQWKRDAHIHRPNAGAVDVGGLGDLVRDALHEALDHEGRKGNHPRHIEGNQPPEPVDQAQMRGQLKLRHDHGGARNDHGEDDEAKQQLFAPKLKLAHHKGHGRGHRRRQRY